MPRGQTQVLLIIGPGINPVSRPTVTIPGPGVTAVGSSLVENGLLVNVKVDANAEVGPRSIFVTTSNLNILSVPGGVYIR